MGGAASQSQCNTSALAHTWRASTGGTVPEDAFVGGMDHNYRMMFICSAMIEGDQTPGKVVPAHNSAMIPHNGTEVWIRNNYYVFCGAKDEFQWLQTNGEKSIPPGAVQGGVTKDGEPIYIGRVKMNGADVIGKVVRSEHKCKVPYGNSEHSHYNFEILVKKNINSNDSDDEKVKQEDKNHF